MVNKYHKKSKKRFEKKRERYQNLSEEEKGKRKKMPKTNVKIFLQRKRKKASVSL